MLKEVEDEATLMDTREREVSSPVSKRYKKVIFNVYQDIRNRQKQVEECDKLKERYPRNSLHHLSTK